MIHEIHIENFRCFEKLEVKGLSRINLFGGLNNAGKTVLLEAVYFMANPTDDTLKNIYAYRKSAGNELNPLDAWFYNRDMSRIIFFEYELSAKKKTSFHFRRDAQGNLNYSVPNSGGVAMVIYSNLRISHLVSPYFRPLKSIFIPVIFKQSVGSLAKQIDQSRRLKTKSFFIEAMQLIDDSIVDIFTFASEPDLVYIEKEGGLVLPLDHQGDALRKMVTYVSHIVESGKDSILLVDEIENGLHHTKQEEFWTMLFKLCIQFDVQVFANTHSLEMIKAYSKVVQNNNWQSEASYFEMYRHPKTNQVKVMQYEMNWLNEKITENRPVRGEIL